MRVTASWIATNQKLKGKRRTRKKLHVPDISCGHCTAAVDKAVKAIDPDARIETDLSSKTEPPRVCWSLIDLSYAAISDPSRAA